MVTLRPSPVDARDAHELLAEYFRARTDGFALEGVGYRTIFPDPAAFEPPAGVFLVLDDDDASAVGCGGIRLVAPGPYGTRYEVKHLYLRPETRGRGWGRLLIDELETRARAFGATELVLDTHHTLEAAGALYARTGFVAIEPYNDNPNATRWYGKTLGAETA
ncbi:GNAT family N-acetyltransferase [Microbacterium allomyrinae]|uniref:GNAT family N-acetyltransferase n=1 Tax=Microbacterium allomyrinae TaxID=2830666 RepID=A0A9X1LZ00_9MICO|nr:GNAT family N-acetyltransferase [Microbacterium allomyrinae]MCC2033830.1 GNAT family N-acetyltransferase [Microbacterium allomyrinae]